jgi:hypothetical protein
MSELEDLIPEQPGNYARLEKQLKPLPANWRHLHKEDLARTRLPGWTYDVALPEQWLRSKAKGNTEQWQAILTQNVWIYPPGFLWGMACDLVNGRIWI